MTKKKSERRGIDVRQIVSGGESEHMECVAGSSRSRFSQEKRSAPG